VSFAQVKVYPGVVFGSEIERPGIVLGGEFFVSEKVSIAPDFIYYFIDKESQVFSSSKIEVKTKLWELNGNMHYYFVNKSNISFYGLGGLNYSHAGVTYKETDTDTGQTETEFDMSDGEVGINLGVGANFPVGRNFTPFTEIKYVAASTDQLVIGAGLKFDIQ
jgi:outer membrane protein X